MLEQVPDLGLHGCITIDASDSASEELKADIPAGEAHVRPEPSESRDRASDMSYSKELSRVGKGSPLCQDLLGLGVRNLSVRRWLLENTHCRCYDTIKSNVRRHCLKLQVIISSLEAR